MLIWILEQNPWLPVEPTNSDVSVVTCIRFDASRNPTRPAVSPCTAQQTLLILNKRLIMLKLNKKCTKTKQRCTRLVLLTLTSLSWR